MLQASLKVVGGKHDGEIIPLRSAKFLIGRESDCHLRPSSDMISRHHCAFTIDDYTVRLRDLGSTNGTFVNGQRVRGTVPLKAGDTIAVGKLQFQLLIGDKAEAEPPDSQPPLMRETAEMSAEETQYEIPSYQELPEQSVLDETNAPSSASPSETTMFSMPAAEESAAEAAVQPAAAPAETPQPAPAEPAPPPGQNPMPVSPPAGVPYPYPGPYPPQPGYYPPPGYPPAGGYYPAYPQQPYPYPQPVVMGQQPVPGQPTAPPAGEQPPAQNPPASGAEQELPQFRLPDPNSTGAATEESSAGSSSDSAEEKKPSEYAADIIRRHLQRRPGGEEE